MNEPICQHCGKSLSEALREGCSESPCKEYKREFHEEPLEEDYASGC